MMQARYHPEQLKQLDEARYSQKTDAINRWVNAVYYYGTGQQRCVAARPAGVCPNTLRKFAAAYERGGLPAVVADARQGPPSALDPHVETIKADFAARPPTSVAQAAARIAQLTKVQLKETRVRNFMRELGMAPRRLTPIPGKADPLVQAAFKKQPGSRAEPGPSRPAPGLLRRRGALCLWPVPGHRLVLVPHLPQDPSRTPTPQRAGALNAVTRHLVHVVNQTYVTAQTVCELLDKLRALHPDDPITIVLDNARYQRCKHVMAHAAARGIDLLFLPAYSPNLNLIERLWKFIKKDCLNGRYHPTHQQFQAAILDSLEAVNTRHRQALETTLMLNFQMFDNAQLLAA